MNHFAEENAPVEQAGIVRFNYWLVSQQYSLCDFLKWVFLKKSTSF